MAVPSTATMEPVIAQAMGLEVWAALASLVTLMMGWMFKRINDNDYRCEENRANNDKLKARLYGESARTDDGDINQFQRRIENMETTHEEFMNAIQDLERVTNDLYGADGDDGRNGIVNEVHELKFSDSGSECGEDGR